MNARLPRLALRPLVLAALLVAVALAGCSASESARDAQTGYAALGFTGSDVTGRLDAAWPDLDGTTLTILDQGAFDYLYGAAAPLFENLTHAKVEHIAALDAGDALQRTLRERGDPSFDVVYGLDNVLLGQAIDADALEPYQPRLASRINASLLFADTPGPWLATPVDHGYTAINVDPRSDLAIASLDDLVAHADQFVTEDPRTSSPGLGFLLATVATYGEKGSSGHDYTSYWDDLLSHGALVTPGWTEAYVQHFSAGYGASSGGAADRTIVNSYTTSPAYEAYSGATVTADVLTAPRSTFHQVETMAIAKGAPHLAAAQAWIEFTLTDAYQELQAPQNAVYPVVDGIDVTAVYANADPAPGSFQDAPFTATQLDADVERWVHEWTEVYERHQA